MSNGITAASLRGTREIVRERAANTFMCADKLFDGLVLQHMIHVAVDDDVVARAQRSLDMGTIYKSLMALAVHECKLLYSLKNALYGERSTAICTKSAQRSSHRVMHTLHLFAGVF